jgi:polyisoprenoid-binding protein YceI
MTTMTSVGAGIWTADLTRTRAGFAARHGFGPTVHGTITVTGGTLDVGPDGQPRRFQATLDPASIDTGNARRDADLRGRRFLDVETYPLMEAAADGIDVAADGWRADAVLRVRRCEAPLRIAATLDILPTGAQLLVSGTARLDLHDAGIRVPGLMVRRFVDLSFSAQLTRQT